jgi:hypothetical protein
MNQSETLVDLRYPIGPTPAMEEPLSAELRRQLISRIAGVPAALRAATAGLTDAQLDTPYRPEGWTVRQVVHHLPDSHMNAYARFRLALTEERPTIKPYDEVRWAELPDARSMLVDVSLALLDALHARLVELLRSLDDDAWHRSVLHPDSGVLTVDRLLVIYSWHGDHHIAHITSLRERMGW